MTLLTTLLTPVLSGDPSAALWLQLSKSSLYRSWARSNPGENDRIRAYWHGGERPTGIRSAFGVFLVQAKDAIQPSP